MDSQRWQQINEVFHAALDAAAEDRGAVLTALTRNDPALRTEVERMLAADIEADGYLESIEIPVHLLDTPDATLRPGELLNGRYRIVEEIAEGGMGFVFRAIDTEIDTEIALKTIRPEIASNPEALARFRSEVVTARSLNSPHICRTFHLERATLPSGGEILFLTMEFLAGETLAARLARGPLPLDEAAEFARQIAEGLRAAHKLGIIHRDMKPANIMVVPAGNDAPPILVVMDFGLARLAPTTLADGRSIFTGTGRAIGTLGYMAPEQLEGTPPAPATDLYAFGLILFEMTTGRRLFPSENLLSGIAQRLKGPPPSPQELAPELPAPWHLAIEACLRTHAADRPQDVDQLLLLLDGTQTRLKPAIQPAPARPRWQWVALIVTICLVAVSLFAAGLRFYQTRANASVAPGALVYLPDVQNETGEHALDSLTELLRAGLTQSVQINLLDQGRAGDIMQQMKKSAVATLDQPTAREIAMRAGAPRVVFSSIKGSNGSYHLDIEIQQPDVTPQSFRHRWTKTFTWRTNTTADSTTLAPELLSAIRDANDWIRAEAGESGSTIASLNTPPEDATTGNWQALAEFSSAQKLVVQGKKEEAAFAYRNALRFDPGFALAYSHLGDLLVSMSHPIEGYQTYLKALNADSGQRLSRKERDFIQGSYASDTRDYATALSAFRDYSAFYPNDFDAWFYQTYPLVMLDRSQEAIQVLLRADPLSGPRHASANELVRDYMLLGNTTEQKKWTEILRQTKHADLALYLDALDSLSGRRYQEAENRFLALESVPSATYRRFAFAGLAKYYAERQNYPASLQVMAEQHEKLGAIETRTEDANSSIDKAYVLCRIHRFGECLSEINRAIQMDPTPELMIWASTILGEAIPQMQSDIAKRAVQCLLDMETLVSQQDLGVVYTLAHLRLQGEVLLANGRPSEALTIFRRADALDAPLRAREYLARCLLAVARQEHDPATVNQLQEEALASYARVALRPAVVRRRYNEYPPGFAADEVQDFVILAKSLHHHDVNQQNAEMLLNDLRGPSRFQPQP